MNTKISRHQQPKSLYKYRAVTKPISKDQSDDEALRACWHVTGLLESRAWISSPHSFNDPFDCKFDIVLPNAAEIKNLLRICPASQLDDLNRWLIDIVDPAKREAHRQFWLDHFHKMVSTYAVYSLAGTANSNLMWSHYSGNHTGFCIEFAAWDFMDPIPVSYKSKVGAVACIELLKSRLSLNDGIHLGKQVHKILHEKLREWEYEKEYRHLSTAYLQSGQSGISVEYPNAAVSSIIFGARMLPSHKQYIIKNVPYAMTFRQADINLRDSRVDILPFDPAKHL